MPWLTYLLIFLYFLVALRLLHEIFEKTNTYKGVLQSWVGVLNRRIAAHIPALWSIQLPSLNPAFIFADQCQESCLVTHWEAVQPTKE